MKSNITNLRSGIVVFLVALPLCLGIALACNVPLFSGILAGIVGGILVTLFSGSTLSVSGPAAGLTSIILVAVSALGSFEIFLAAVLFAGAFQIVLGLIKAGGVGNFVPSAVIKGMLAGIGIILIMKQIPHLVGYDRDPEGNFDFFQQDGHNTFTDLYYMFDYISPGAVIIGIVSILILLMGERAFYKNDKILSLIPTPLLVVVVGALLNISFNKYGSLLISPEHMVALPVIKNFGDLSNTLIFPDFSSIYKPGFWGVVITLAAVASLESLLSLEATDKLDPEKRYSNSNKELIAQGIGNMACGLIGALPVTAVIVRSSANIHAGATSKLSSIIHGALLLLAIFLIPNVLMLIPNASLAAILVITGYKLTKLDLFKEHFKKGIDQFLPFLVTIVVMLTTDLLKGVGAGVAVSLFFIIRYNIKSSFEIAEDIIDGKRNYLIKLPQYITFFNKGFIITYLNKVKTESRVIIDGSINRTTDKDVQEVFHDFAEKAKENNIEIQLVKYKIL
ncbi:SulP family inorganic anion transporter [Aurantibacillus circumpalustris]|uniref:SulP family inorganic anion transporter n=1 Tax=Aurantibacillus circumpalustris TaxID=3036359 RepID=UPI00295B318D|nr:SulP family inorganic anion transporter [Aurantibacillus circumpalustris]